jgi:hypothetical protein
MNINYTFRYNIVNIVHPKSKIYIWIHDITSHTLSSYEQRFIFEDRANVRKGWYKL